MINFDLIRENLCEIIKSSNKLNKNQIKYLVDETRALSDSSTLKVVLLLTERKKLNPKMKKALQYALAGSIVTAMIIMPGSVETSLLIRKIVTMYNWKCEYKCRTDHRVKKDLRLCYKKCDSSSLKKAEIKIKRDLFDCKFSPKPDKCREHLYKQLIKIKEKQVQADYNLEKYIRKHSGK